MDPLYNHDGIQLFHGDANDFIAALPDNMVQLVITSPTYWGKRGFTDDAREFGGESLEQYIDRNVTLYDAILQKLQATGSLFIIIQDSYMGSGISRSQDTHWDHIKSDRYMREGLVAEKQGNTSRVTVHHDVIPNQSLCGTPWEIALRLLKLKKGYIWRQIFFWSKCLAKDTLMFVKQNETYRLMTVEEIYQNFDGNMYKVITQDRNGHELEVAIKNVFYSGHRQILKIKTNTGRVIRCTSNHNIVAQKAHTTVHYGKSSKNFRIAKTIAADHLMPGNHILVNVAVNTTLRDGDNTEYNDGWCVGFYIAEGSWVYRDYKPYKNNKISLGGQTSALIQHGYLPNRGRHRRGVQFSCGILDRDRGYFTRLARYHINANQYNNVIQLTNYDDLFHLIEQYVDGEACNTKRLLDSAFNKSKAFLKGILDGFLAVDGHYEESSRRWRIKIKPNNLLIRQFETICRILGYEFRHQNDTRVFNKQTGKYYTAAVFQIRMRDGSYRMRRQWQGMMTDKIRSIENDGEDDVYDIEIETIDDDKVEWVTKRKTNFNHLYFLANGIWTHNSNPQPENVENRAWQSCEYILHFVKSPDYTCNWKDYWIMGRDGLRPPMQVWEYDPAPRDGHTATFPPKLIRKLVRSFSNRGDVIADPFTGSGTTCLIAREEGRKFMGTDINKVFIDDLASRLIAQPTLFATPHDKQTIRKYVKIAPKQPMYLKTDPCELCITSIITTLKNQVKSSALIPPWTQNAALTYKKDVYHFAAIYRVSNRCVAFMYPSVKSFDKGGAGSFYAIQRAAEAIQYQLITHAIILIPHVVKIDGKSSEIQASVKMRIVTIPTSDNEIAEATHSPLSSSLYNRIYTHFLACIGMSK